MLLALVLVAAGCAQEKEYYPRPTEVTSVQVDPALTAENHPRLLMHAEDFEALRRRIDAGDDKTLAATHALIMRIADSYKAAGATDPLEFQLDEAGKRILTVSRAALTRIFHCAYAYRMTGEKKYLEHAEDDIRTVCSFASWNAKSHFLDVAEMCTAVALGYDWLYADLSADTRAMVEKAIVEYAFTPARSKVWNLNFYQSPTNWNQVCNAGLVLGALAIYEQYPVLCQNMIDASVASNLPIAATIYSPDGSYPEGYSYWGYGTTFQVLMMACLESAQGKDYGMGNIHGLSKTGPYIMFMESPVNLAFNYSDGGAYTSFLVANWYLARKYDDPGLLYAEVQKLPRYTMAAAGTEERLLPMVMAFVGDVDLDGVKAPSQTVWSGDGLTPLVMVRTGWGGDASDKYLGIKGGRARTSHGHMDTGSFVFDADGVRWAADLGSTSYTAAENAMKAAGGNFWTMTQESLRWTFMRLHNKFHNTLTVNDADHRVEEKCAFTAVLDDAHEKGGTIDLTPALSGEVASAVRTAKIVDNESLVVIDEVKALAGKEARVRWTLVTEAEADVQADRIVLTRSGQVRTLTVAADVPVTLTRFSTEKWHSYDDDLSAVRVVGFEAVVPAGSSATFTVRL